jgi:hypothetical protein
MNIPICPNCKKGTMREELTSTTTLMFIPTTYDEQGNLIHSPHKNKVTTQYRCIECGTIFSN